MSEAFKEQRPLLCEEYSEEEPFAEYPRRYRPAYRGRARNTAKGATAIITRWPEHWSSTLTYWWIGLSMMAVTIFIVYNSVIAFVLLPAAHMKPARARTNKVDTLMMPSHLPEVYLHIFTNNNDETNLNKYLPYIERLSDKHMDYNFNVIVLLNKTADGGMISAEENNEIAFNSLWTKDHFYRRKTNTRKNIKIKQVSLSHYMDESPLQKNWRLVPNQFIEFLVKTIAVWDKGGIAINPILLTPRSPNPIYAEKLETIFHKYKNFKEIKPNENKIRKSINKHKDKFRKKVNNIRDIIDILEHDDSLTYPQDNLTEAEDAINPTIARSGRRLLSTSILSTTNKTRTDLIMFPNSHLKIYTQAKNNGTEYVQENFKPILRTLNDNEVVEAATIKESSKSNHTSKLSLLPLFLEFLFHDKSKLNLPKGDEQDMVMEKSSGRYRKSTVFIEKLKRNLTTTQSFNKTETNSKEQYSPMIISAKGIIPDEFLLGNEENELDVKKENSDELTIDIKGNIIATKTACHAFVGTIFSNIIHHTEEVSLQDFIIAELSLFCKGLLSSCRGIDVILL